jgi:phenylalanyl-tRNA synthetase beta chain
MANITFPRKEFESEIKITNEIEKKINLFGTPLEFMNNEEINIEVFPNRPDLYTIQGYLRALKAFIGKEKGLKKYNINKPEKDYKVYVEKQVKDIRGHTACAIVKGLKLNNINIKELMNAQEKLSSTLGRNRKKMGLGLYPLEKIKFPITYTAKNSKEIKYIALGLNEEHTAEEILKIHPTGRKYGHLLENHKMYPVFIDKNKKIMSMPPIVNSEETGRITTNTDELFIECTGTEKSSVEKALIIMTTTLADMGGKIYPMEIIDHEKYNTPDFTTQKTKISLSNVENTIGVKLNEKQVGELLSRMGHSYKSGIVESPAWRTDILHEIDLIEDITIALGYDQLSPSIPKISTVGEESRNSILKRKMSSIIAEIEFDEISTYHLIKQGEEEYFKNKDIIELLDSKTEYKFLRNNLITPMIRILSENKDVEYPHKLFEIGKVFSKNLQKETGVEEEEHLILAISPSNTTTIKQNIDYIFRKINIKYSIKENNFPNLIDGRCAEIIVNNKQVGSFGEVHPNFLKNVGIKMPLAIAEINLENIYDKIN